MATEGTIAQEVLHVLADDNAGIVIYRQTARRGDRDYDSVDLTRFAFQAPRDRRLRAPLRSKPL